MITIIGIILFIVSTADYGCNILYPMTFWKGKLQEMLYYIGKRESEGRTREGSMIGSKELQGGGEEKEGDRD